MLSSVPITIGEEIFQLQFTPADVDEIERAMGDPIAYLLVQKRLLSIGVAGVMLWHGLKITNPENKLVRAIPLTASGKERALELVRVYLRGRDVLASIELSNRILEGFEAGEWYNLKETKSNPQPVEKVEPPKNSDVPGSRRTRK